MRIAYVEKNGQRYRVGESHQRSTISDDLVETIRNHHDFGLGRRRIWLLLKQQGIAISLSSVRRILAGEVRAQRPQRIVDTDA